MAKKKYTVTGTFEREKHYWAVVVTYGGKLKSIATCESAFAIYNEKKSAIKFAKELRENKLQASVERCSVVVSTLAAHEA